MADELGWERFSLMGYSMGVKVAHQVLLQTQHRVRRLVGINPVPAAEVPMDELAWALFHGAAGEPANRADRQRRHLLSWAKSDFSGQVTNDASVPVKVIVGGNRPGPVRHGDGADVAELKRLIVMPFELIAVRTPRAYPDNFIMHGSLPVRCGAGR